MRLQIGL